MLVGKEYLLTCKKYTAERGVQFVGKAVYILKMTAKRITVSACYVPWASKIQKHRPWAANAGHAPRLPPCALPSPPVPSLVKFQMRSAENKPENPPKRK